jgi:hypothetical protein
LWWPRLLVGHPLDHFERIPICDQDFLESARSFLPLVLISNLCILDIRQKSLNKPCFRNGWQSQFEYGAVEQDGRFRKSLLQTCNLLLTKTVQQVYDLSRCCFIDRHVSLFRLIAFWLAGRNLTRVGMKASIRIDGYRPKFLAGCVCSKIPTRNFSLKPKGAC